MKVIYKDFQANLSRFAEQYRNEINRNTEFREKFNRLCLEMGVDPLVSRRTMWSGLGFGEFYNQLAQKVLDICNKHRSVNGGIMKITDIITYYNRNNREPISKYDVTAALQTMNKLGTGCSILRNEYVCTVPFSLSDDSQELMNVAEEVGYVSARVMQEKRRWEVDRFEAKIRVLVQEGLVWVDRQAGSDGPRYYFPSQINFN
eukprot:TRINITY_DN1119_c0_g1_i7.p1 TRINITY_DN1119_c0_g1~~TRINITY_DN1119_c0_g1_i7.p1  ORF type:complete len:203 (-),score=39.50 TRINITY_DN1119_c0_g1_i7:147-755(-)